MKPHRFLMYTLVPLLAIGGYIAADLLVDPAETETPLAYRLEAKQECDLNTQCILQHEALVIRLSRDHSGQGGEAWNLRLESSESLKGAAISLGRKDEMAMPENMQSHHSDRQWRITLLEHNPEGILRLLLSTRETRYFAELPVTL